MKRIRMAIFISIFIAMSLLINHRIETKEMQTNVATSSVIAKETAIPTGMMETFGEMKRNVTPVPYP